MVKKKRTLYFLSQWSHSFFIYFFVLLQASARRVAIQVLQLSCMSLSGLYCASMRHWRQKKGVCSLPYGETWSNSLRSIQEKKTSSKAMSGALLVPGEHRRLYHPLNLSVTLTLFQQRGWNASRRGTYIHGLVQTRHVTTK